MTWDHQEASYAQPTPLASSARLLAATGPVHVDSGATVISSTAGNVVVASTAG